MTVPAPPRRVAHYNNPIRGAGGTLSDSLRGSARAQADNFRWGDCNGHSSSDAWPFNMHGQPFSPPWLRRAGKKLEAYSAAWIMRHHPRLRTAEKTFTDNAKRGLSTEWEVKDLHPVTSADQLAHYFAKLALAARKAYGDDWKRRVEVKCLTNLGGGLPYAKRILKAAHATGFTTMVLPRGKHKRIRINEPFITYNRGGRV